jgi:hypothetical protein
MSRVIVRAFEATPVPREYLLASEGLDVLAGGQWFEVGMPPVNSTFFPDEQFVDGVPVVQFICGDSLLSYCVERSIYEISTKPISETR